MVYFESTMTLFSFIFFVVWRWLGWLFRLGRLPRKFLHVHSSCPGRGSRWVYQWVPRTVQEPAVHGTAHTMKTRSRDGSSVNLPAAQCPHSHPRGREHTPLTMVKRPTTDLEFVEGREQRRGGPGVAGRPAVGEQALPHAGEPRVPAAEEGPEVRGQVLRHLGRGGACADSARGYLKRGTPGISSRTQGSHS